MKSKILINQFQGLGDILFCEPIARTFKEQGKTIIWPVIDQYIWIAEYIPYINFVSKSQFAFNYEALSFEDSDIEYLPLRFANPIYRGLHPHDYSDQYHCMLDKYRMLNLDENLWRTLKWNRNPQKEKELFDRVVGNKKNYTLINKTWGGHITNNDIQDETEAVYCSYVDGYSMLDWAMVYENASTIKTVSTSNLYMIEALNVNADVFIYPRKPHENNLDGIKEFVNKKFNLVL
jgi:hypothetical protein